MKRVTPELVKAIFYSGQFGFSGDQEVTAKIAFLVNHNYLLLSKVHIATKAMHLEICSDIATLHSRSEASGGGNEHIALKLLAEKYLLQEYGVGSLFEQTFLGFIPDVRSIDNAVVCECGHTNNPEKLYTYLRHPDVRTMIQIPYPDDSDKTVWGYKFQAQPNLFQFLDYESADSTQAIKSILNRR